MYSRRKTIEETAPHYRSIGIILLKDRHGNRVRVIEMDRRTSADKIRDIYTIWLEEDPYHSWATLCECFRQCNLLTLSQRIEQHFQMVSPPTSPGSYNSELYVVYIACFYRSLPNEVYEILPYIDLPMIITFMHAGESLRSLFNR